MSHDFEELCWVEELSIEELSLLTQEAGPVPYGCFETIERGLEVEGRTGWLHRFRRLQVDAGLERCWRTGSHNTETEDYSDAKDREPYQPFNMWEEEYQPLTRARLGLLSSIHSTLKDPLLKEDLADIMYKLGVPEANYVPLPALRLER